MVSRFLTILVSLLVLGAGSANSQVVKRIVLHDKAETAGPRILLGEIADIKGFDSRTARRLSNLDAGCAALPGKSRLVAKNKLESLVKSVYKAGPVLVIGPESFPVVTRARRVEPDEIFGMVRAFIESRMPWKNDRVEIKFKAIKSDFLVPDRRLVPRVEAVGDEDYLGYSLFNLIMEEDGREVARFPVSCNIRVFRKVLVSSSRIPRASSLTGENVKVEEREITGLPGKALTSLQQARGLETVRIISPGRIITSDMVAPPVVINRGDQVQVVAYTGSILIRLPATAEEPGRVGEFVTIRNSATGKKLQAKVVDSKTVEIRF